MTNPPPQRERAPAAAPAQRRRVAVPGSQQKQRRGGLLVLGLVLVFGAGAGFWFVLQSVDQRTEYLMTARTIQRWEEVRASDFMIVEADVGNASALTVDQSGRVLGKWATGRIPAGTLVTEGLFETPPLSAESEADRVLIQVRLPASEAPFGTLNTGDTVALLGRESQGLDGETGALGLIGVLRLEFVQGDDIFYVVTPDQALDIKASIDRFNQSADRTILKLGHNLSSAEIADALERQAASVPPALSGGIAELGEVGSGAVPVEDQ
ncbi:MAG: hypothetical protein OXG66_02545 [Acidimicrobiaceae bacterium]|nr:hypothetical protein [Acidimicrobiaceae bacterium]